jgi:hypothetical protein
MTLNLVQQLADQLSVAEQLQLLAYLAPKLADALGDKQDDEEGDEGEHFTAWDTFFAVGDALADDDGAPGQSMTDTVISMRR